MDESAVIARAVAGDHQAFHELLERHSGPLFATLRARLANREDAREVLQETWLRAWEHLARLREPDHLHSWLVSIALNLVRARQRRTLERAGADRGGGDEALELAASGAGEGGLAEREELARLRARMAELPARQREVVDLRVNHELSHAQIAGLLGISAEASRANYYQALRRLKGALAGEGDEA